MQRAGHPTLLELLLPAGEAERAAVLGSACPPRLLPASRPDDGSGGLDLVVIAPTAAEERRRGWLRAAVDVCSARLTADGLVYVLVRPSARPLARRLLRAHGHGSAARTGARAPGTVRFVSRFLDEREIPAYFRRADIVVLPYRQIDQSGVLYTALAFGKALVLSAVGGFSETSEGGTVARLVAPGDRDALASELSELAHNPAMRAQLERAAARAAEDKYSWDGVAERTLALYGRLVAQS